MEGFVFKKFTTRFSGTGTSHLENWIVEVLILGKVK